MVGYRSARSRENSPAEDAIRKKGRDRGRLITNFPTIVSIISCQKILALRPKCRAAPCIIKNMTTIVDKDRGTEL